MTIQGLLLGLINIAIVMAVLLLIGAVIVWFCTFFQTVVPENVRRAYLLVVGLIGLYMLIALLIGIPTIRFIGAPAPA